MASGSTVGAHVSEHSKRATDKKRDVDAIDAMIARALFFPRVVLDAPDCRSVRTSADAPPYYYHARSRWCCLRGALPSVTVEEIWSHPMFERRRRAQACDFVIETIAA
jgi:hypothetical protein